MNRMILVCLLAASCGANGERFSAPDRGWPDPGSSEGPCGGVTCTAGFHCEYDACVPDDPPPPLPAPGARDPLASHRFVFALEVEARRLVRIDSLTLEVAAFAAGLAPMDMAVVGSRELSLLLDALDIIEVLDHRQRPPIAAAWSTARALSHLRVAPSGEHAIAYFDWDDPRAQARQSEPGNINQVSVLALRDGSEPFADEDARLLNIAVGFLPRDIRFSSDGARAVVISRDTLTRILLLAPEQGVALPEPSVVFDGSAAEILIDSEAERAVLRYAGEARVDVLDLASGGLSCLAAPAAVTDIALDRDGRLLVAAGDSGGRALVAADLADASPEPCVLSAVGIDIGAASRLAVDRTGNSALAYSADSAVEAVWHVDLATLEVTQVRLEKAVAGVAFAGDGRYALLSHVKLPGAPAWDPSVEDPEVSVDKSYGVSWLDLTTDAHRLAVSDVPFGPFVFVPALPVTAAAGATYQAVLDDCQPQVLRVSHQPGFDDRWLDVAAMPLTIGYLPETGRTYVTQSHPWGRVTFIDAAGDELRHVTGYAMEVQ